MSDPTKRELAEALRAALQNCVAGGKDAAEVLERYDRANPKWTAECDNRAHNWRIAHNLNEESIRLLMGGNVDKVQQESINRALAFLNHYDRSSAVRAIPPLDLGDTPKAGDIVRLKVNGGRGQCKGKFGVLQGLGTGGTFGVHIPEFKAPGEENDYVGPYSVEQFEVMTPREVLRALQKICPDCPDATLIVSCPRCGKFTGA